MPSVETLSSIQFALPVDYVVRPGDLPHVRAVIDDFSEAILNPSTLDRLCHTILACWITGAFVVVAVSAWWLLRGHHVESARASLKIGMTVAMLACLLQMVAADSTARGVSRNQPTQLAAIEGLASTRKEAGLGVVGVPIVLSYTITIYYVFRGKVELTDESY